jgi:hypothetical protein
MQDKKKLAIPRSKPKMEIFNDEPSTPAFEDNYKGSYLMESEQYLDVESVANTSNKNFL